MSNQEAKDRVAELHDANSIEVPSTVDSNIEEETDPRIKKLADEGFDVQWNINKEETFTDDFDYDYELHKSSKENSKYLKSKVIADWFEHLTVDESREILNTTPSTYAYLRCIYDGFPQMDFNFTIDDIYSDLTSEHIKGILPVSTFVNNTLQRNRRSNNLHAVNDQVKTVESTPAEAFFQDQKRFDETNEVNLSENIVDSNIASIDGHYDRYDDKFRALDLTMEFSNVTINTNIDLIDESKFYGEVDEQFDCDYQPTTETVTEAPTTIIVDGVEKTESDTPEYNPDIPDDMSHVVDGDYLIDSECADKSTMIDPYYSLGVDATKDSDVRDFKSEYDAIFNDIVNKPTPSMSDYYEKIAYPKFSEFVLRDFDVVVDSRLVDKAIRRLDAVRRMLAPIKSIIREEEALLDQLNKIMSKIGFREEFVNPAIDSTAIAKIKRVPNNQDELILVTTTGMTVSELQNRITGLTGKLHGLKIKRERIEFEIIKLEAFLELDENVAYSELFVDENVIIAVKKIEGIVVGIVTNHSGEKLLESVDFISPQDTYDESLAMRRLIRKYYDSFDSDTTDTDSECIGNGDCETCGGCGYGVDHPEDN